MCEYDPLRCDCHEWAPRRSGKTRSEAFRLHRVHCEGCPEYRNHGGDRVEPKPVQRAVAGHGEFDSPPPPPTASDLRGLVTDPAWGEGHRASDHIPVHDADEVHPWDENNYIPNVPGDHPIDLTYTEGERLDRPGNRANGCTCGPYAPCPNHDDGFDGYNA